MRKAASLCIALSLAGNLAGCASTSGKTFAQLDRASFEYHTDRCQEAIRATQVHDDINLWRTLASPVAVLVSGGLLLPAVFATNVGLDTVDRVDASRMEQHCGGEGKSVDQIAEDVVASATLGLATGAVGGRLVSGSAIGTAAK